VVIWPSLRAEGRSLILGLERRGRLLLLLALATGAAFVMSTCTTQTNAFSIQALTDVVTVEPSCGRFLTWDLGPGVLAVTDLAAVPPPPGQAASAMVPAASAPTPTTVTIGFGPGSKLVLERLPDESLRAVLTPSPQFEGCASRPELVEYSVQTQDGGLTQVTEQKAFGNQAFKDLSLEFRSAPSAAAAASAPTSFTHPLEGRIVLGAALQHGAGWGVSSAPLLRSAELSARTRETFTGQSITVLAERIDGGSIIDTAPCFAGGPSDLDRGRHLKRKLREWAGLDEPGRSPVCVSGMQGPAVGFVRPHKDGGLDVIAHAAADRLGVTPHQGEMREIQVTWWAELKNSPWLLSFIAALFFLGNLGQQLSSLAIWKAAPDRPCTPDDLEGPAK